MVDVGADCKGEYSVTICGEERQLADLADVLLRLAHLSTFNLLQLPEKLFLNLLRSFLLHTRLLLFLETLLTLDLRLSLSLLFLLSLLANDLQDFRLLFIELALLFALVVLVLARTRQDLAAGRV